MKRYLRERHVPFHEVDVTKSESGMLALRRKSGGTGVPVIDVNGKVVVGFDRTKLDRALGVRS